MHILNVQSKDITPIKVQKVLKLMMAGLLVSLLLASCQREYKDPIPDVSHIEIEAEFIHYDSLLRVHMEKGVEGLEELKEKYPAFSDIYFHRILEIWDPEEPLDSLYNRMDEFMSSDFYRDIQDTIHAAIPDFGPIKREYEQALHYYHYHFPHKNVPPVYLFISEFTFANIIFQDEKGGDALGIGIDMFCHGHFDYTVLSYFNTMFSAYNVRTLNADHIVKKTFDAKWDGLLGPEPRGRMIDIMLYHGKKHHLNKLVLPHAPDTVIFEYTPEQMQWVRDNEAQIYNHLIENDLLYTTDLVKYSRLVSPSPHSPGMPPEAPGQVVNWLGYQIIRAWVRNNPDKTLSDLLDKRDGHEFLMQSRYRPGRY